MWKNWFFHINLWPALIASIAHCFRLLNEKSLEKRLRPTIENTDWATNRLHAYWATQNSRHIACFWCKQFSASVFFWEPNESTFAFGQKLLQRSLSGRNFHFCQFQNAQPCQKLMHTIIWCLRYGTFITWTILRIQFNNLKENLLIWKIVLWSPADFLENRSGRRELRATVLQ